jgi:hypothetical protein
MGKRESVIAKRLPDESNDSVNLVVSLLVRHPELSRIIIKPRFSAIAFFFVVRAHLSKAEQLHFRRTVFDHFGALHRIDGLRSPKIAVRLVVDSDLTFVEIERDAKSLARDEISLMVGLITQFFGERLVVNPPAEDEPDDEFGSQEDAVGSALDAVRRGKQRKGLVGFREERRVLIYFGK